jgi:S1-C subfamily serine protease
MTYELLPEDEPGNPLPDVPAGFTDSVMELIVQDQRKRRRRRRAAVALATAIFAGSGYLLAARWVDDGPMQNSVQTHAAPKAAPVVTAPHVASPAPPQDAVNGHTPVRPRSQHTPPADAVVAADTRPGDIRIMIDGKEIRDPAEVQAILNRMRSNCESNRIELIRDGKPVTYTTPAGSAGTSPCSATPSPAPRP